MNLIEVHGVTKAFRRHQERKLVRDQLRDMMRPRPESLFRALDNVSFTVAEGESLGIIGANGAGKSTLLNLIAGLARPDEGTVTVQGRVAALLELGSGFHPDLTGEENIFLNAAFLGFTRKQAHQMRETIVEFAEIGDFIHEPLRTYSSGMVVRLAFAVAVHVNPSILIVDEVLGVGDSHFQEKCVKRIRQLRGERRTLVCVSHNASMIKEFCDRAVWLDHGRLVADGGVPPVLDAYLAYAANPAAGLPLREQVLVSAPDVR